MYSSYCIIITDHRECSFWMEVTNENFSVLCCTVLYQEKVIQTWSWSWPILVPNTAPKTGIRFWQLVLRSDLLYRRIPYGEVVLKNVLEFWRVFHESRLQSFLVHLLLCSLLYTSTARARSLRSEFLCLRRQTVSSRQFCSSSTNCCVSFHRPLS